MSKTVKSMMMDAYRDRLEGHDDALLINIRGVDAITNNAMRMGLLEKDIHVTVVRNKLVKTIFEGTSLEALSPLLNGPSTLAYGAESVVEVAREVVKLLEQHPDIELKGAVLDGQLFEGEAGVKALSKFPTRDEAIAKDVTLLLGPGRKLVGSVLGPGRTVAGVLKSIQDKLEKNETISKVS